MAKIVSDSKLNDIKGSREKASKVPTGTIVTVAAIGGVAVGGWYFLNKLFETAIEADQISISSYTVKTIQAAPGSLCTLDFTWFCVSAPTVWKLKWGFIPVQEKADYKPTFHLGLRKVGTEEWAKGPGQQGADYITEGESQDVTIATEIPTDWGDAGYVDLAIFCSGIDEPLLIIPSAVQVIWGASSQIETISVTPITTGDVTSGQEVEVQITFKAVGVPTPPHTTIEYTFRLDTYAGAYVELGSDHYFGYKIELAENEEATINLLGKVSDAAMPGTPVDIEICCYSETTGSIWDTEYLESGMWTVAMPSVGDGRVYYGPAPINIGWQYYVEFGPGGDVPRVLEETWWAVAWTNEELEQTLYGVSCLELSYGGTLFYSDLQFDVVLPPGVGIAVGHDSFIPHAIGTWHLYAYFHVLGVKTLEVEFDFMISEPAIPPPPVGVITFHNAGIPAGATYWNMRWQGIDGIVHDAIEGSPPVSTTTITFECEDYIRVVGYYYIGEKILENLRITPWSTFFYPVVSAEYELNWVTGAVRRL